MCAKRHEPKEWLVKYQSYDENRKKIHDIIENLSKKEHDKILMQIIRLYKNEI